MKIRFCGATKGVTGSCHLFESGEHKVLLDCGQFQGSKEQDEMNFEDFPFDPTSIECVILSHAHIDHCGRLPLLTKRGFSGKIYCTDATADLLAIMLKDSAYIQEKEAEWQNRKNQRAGRALVEPLYTIQDAEDALKLIQPVLYDQLIEINPEMKVVFNDAGHILGSAIIEIWLKEGEKESKIVFSGDIGMTQRPILRDPTFIKKADYVIMESTYGDRNHPIKGSGAPELIDIVLKTTARGGNVVIPSFAVGRTQELIYEFNKYYEAHSEVQAALDKINVYVDSPMATSATEVFRKNAQVFDDEMREMILKGDNPLDFKNLIFTRSSDESQQLNFNTSPKIIISASGMCEAGRIRHHLKHNLWDKKNSIVFVGYQAQGTLGRALIEGAKTVTLFGEEISVNAELYNLEGFSGHADQNGLFTWISGFENKPKKVFLVHGEESAKQTLAGIINEKLGFDTEVIMDNSEYELDMNTDSVVRSAVYKAEADRDKAEEVKGIRTKISEVHHELEHILYNANLALESDADKEKITEINNILQELGKATINLGFAISKSSEEEKNQ